MRPQVCFVLLHSIDFISTRSTEQHLWIVYSTWQSDELDDK